MPVIIAIVEGYGEVEAVPILIRRIADAIVPGTVPQVQKPIRVPRNRLLKEGELERYIELAASQSGADGRILIILDADDDLPCEKGPEILRRAKATRSDRRIRVVLACREYEAWFLGAADSLVEVRRLSSDTTAPVDPEAIRDAKGWLADRMAAGGAYKETRDQPAFSALFDLERARRGAPSFDKMWRTVEDLIR